MKLPKKLLLTTLFVAIAMPSFAYNWYAPNSFDTVKKDSWDYRTVYTLCEAGKAPDYSLGFFDKELTRYELASVIKNILEHQEEADDTETLQRLKKDYARELEALGYKEKKKKPSDGVKPLFEIHGDSRIRYNSQSEADARARVNGTWHIGKTDIVAGGKAGKGNS